MISSDLSLATSTSSSSSSTCHCGSVCLCELGRPFAGEGEGEGTYTTSSPVSWQHFPRSTSTRSRCDDSEMASIPMPSLPESSCKVEEEEEGRKKKKSVARLSSTEYPITKSLSQLAAEHYLKIRHIFEFFNFLIGHLICAEPDDPLEYLSGILDRCIASRDCFGEPPLLVTEHHLNTLFATFDPYGTGAITPEQYDEAMRSIGIAKGITRCRADPPLNDDGKIDVEFFMQEASRCLGENFKKMVRIPKEWEENRRVWKKVMHGRFVKRQKRLKPCADYYPDVEEAGEVCYSVSEPDSICPCAKSGESGVCPVKYEPVQLFLDAE